MVADQRLAYALDASALLALLQGEAGQEMIAEVLPHSVISSVNYAEVMQKVLSRGELPASGLRRGLEAVGLAILPFEAEDAERVAALWDSTRRAGLSLGDRACLALAAEHHLTALTTDRAWAELELPVEVYLLR